jgi:hypothetical protein
MFYRALFPNRDVHRCTPAVASVGCATVKPRQNDPHAETVVLPPDEIAAQRRRKREKQLSVSQIHRLLVAAELRKRANQSE